MEIVPPHTHRQVSVWRSAGRSPIDTVGDPGAHGAGVFGAQGCGVRTPPAAAVAAAVAGNEGDMHGPNGTIFTIGLWSPMFAAISPAAVRWREGATRSCEGLGLIVQTVFAVLTTCRAIAPSVSPPVAGAPARDRSTRPASWQFRYKNRRGLRFLPGRRVRRSPIG